MQDGGGFLFGDVHFADVVDGRAIHIHAHFAGAAAVELVRLGEDGLQIGVEGETQAARGWQLDFMTVHMRFAFLQRVGFVRVGGREPDELQSVDDVMPAVVVAVVARECCGETG